MGHGVSGISKYNAFLLCHKYVHTCSYETVHMMPVLSSQIMDAPTWRLKENPMKAMLLEEYGPEAQFTAHDIAKPVAGPGQKSGAHSGIQRKYG